MNPLADHFPAGCWRQPDDSYAGQCSCGHAFHGPTHAAAKKAWANHAAPPVEGLTSGEGVRESLTELVAAMRRYEVEVDGDAPQHHRDMMERADRALAASPKATATASGREAEASVCEHGIRSPWQCYECDEANPPPPGYDPLAGRGHS